MKLGISYKFLFYLLLIVVLAYISLKYFNVIEGNRSTPKRSNNVATGTRQNKNFNIYASVSDDFDVEWWNENCRSPPGGCAYVGNKYINYGRGATGRGGGNGRGRGAVAGTVA